MASHGRTAGAVRHADAHQRALIPSLASPVAGIFEPVAVRGADGAPYRHDGSSELFFVLDGELDALVVPTSSPRVPATC
jgi:hypothetical protein